jgi:hypothetical protein
LGPPELLEETVQGMPSYGINRRDLDRILISMGGDIVLIRSTGEIAYTHPRLPERPRANGRRKDAPTHLVKFVRRVLELAEGDNRSWAA